MATVQMASLVDTENGPDCPSSISEEEIYRQERVFARHWTLHCHETQNPNPGHSLTTALDSQSWPE